MYATYCLVLKTYFIHHFSLICHSFCWLTLSSLSNSPSNSPLRNGDLDSRNFEERDSVLQETHKALKSMKPGVKTAIF